MFHSHKFRMVISVCLGLLLIGLTLGAGQASAPQAPNAPAGTTFTYQGRLEDSSGPVNGTCDFQFSLYDAAGGGSQVGSTQTAGNMTVSDGYFSADLDFGSSAFQGSARYLEIAVRCPAGSGSYSTLSGRVALTAAPYAQYALSAPWSGLSGVPSGLNDGDDDTLGALSCSNGQIAKWNGTAWVCGSDNNTTTFWSLTGNTGTTAGTNFLGTTDNQPLEFQVNGQRVLRLEPSSGTPNLIGGYSGNSVGTGVVGAVIAGGGAAGAENRATANYVTVSGGWDNTASNWYAAVGGGADNTVTGSVATVGGGWNNTASGGSATVGGGEENIASGFAATVSGGQYNTASNYHATVSGGESNIASGAGATVGGGGYDGSSARGNQALAAASTIAGGYGNVITTTATYATVGGGYGNTASNYAATVGGGDHNTVTGSVTTVGGGWNNTASGGSATVGGGEENIASGFAATVGGGQYNTASNYHATVSGGKSNTASGTYATVPGGYYNTAAGDYSFAAGRQANANNPGCFVWGDSSSSTAITCSNDNRTIFRSTGGFYIYTNSGLTSGAYLAAGSGSWATLSDVNAKHNFSSVEPQQILASVAQLPIGTWAYRDEPGNVRHIGPTAQDFYAAFGLGADKTHIATVDADGVALAAIQGLYAQNQAQNARIVQLESENTALREQVDTLETRLTALEQQVGGASVPTSAVPNGGLAFGGLALLAGAIYLRRKEGGQQ